MSAELVLVVDDEPTVREVVSRYLELGGYRVLVAADGQAALELALSTQGPPDLSCSTSCCQAWMASRCAAGCARSRQFRSSC
jgi:CheY-like chemotaxis protein